MKTFYQLILSILWMWFTGLLAYHFFWEKGVGNAMELFLYSLMMLVCLVVYILATASIWDW